MAAKKQPEPPPDVSAMYDHARRRRTSRQGRMKGVKIYIPADELVAAGIDPDGPCPYYRVWGTPRGGVFVRLYKNP